jgi:hypothetical protein
MLQVSFSKIPPPPLWGITAAGIGEEGVVILKEKEKKIRWDKFEEKKDERKIQTIW